MEDKSASVTVSGAGEPFLPTWQWDLAWSYLGTTVWGTQHLPLHNPSQRDPEGILVSPGMRSGSSPVQVSKTPLAFCATPEAAGKC